MTYKQHISGIDGWLAFLIVVLMILWPTMGFSRFVNEFRDILEQYPQLAGNLQWQNYRQVSGLIFLSTAAISFAAGYRLWKIHSPESVRFAIFALWLVGPIGNILYIVSTTVIFRSLPSENELAQMIGGTLASCIMAGIWTAYLMLSHRVKNTYRTWQPATPMTTTPTSSSDFTVFTRSGWWRNRSKSFRVWVFASALWVVGVVLCVIAFEPYGYLIDNYDTFNMLFVMLVPPVFVGVSKYVYDRWVR